MTVTSVSAKSVDDSESVKVTVAVSPTFSVLSSVVTMMVGGVVSEAATVTIRVALSTPPLSSLMVYVRVVAVPENPETGVKV